MSYTPTTTNVRKAYVRDKLPYAAGGSVAEFNRFLEAVRAEAKAEALREAVSDFQHSVGVGEFDEQTRRDGNRHAHIDEAWEYQSPYMDWLLNRADNLATS